MDRRCRIAGTLLIAIMGNMAYPAHGQLEQTQLAIEVSGVNAPKGQICLNLFNGSAGFPSNRNRALQTQCISAVKNTPLVASFENLSPGSYAVSLYHDANSDNKFNRNFVGMPVEGFGFSRNPDARTGPPDFDQAVFLVAGAETRIEIELKYF